MHQLTYLSVAKTSSLVSNNLTFWYKQMFPEVCHWLYLLKNKCKSWILVCCSFLGIHFLFRLSIINSNDNNLWMDQYDLVIICGLLNRMIENRSDYTKTSLNRHQTLRQREKRNPAVKHFNLHMPDQHKQPHLYSFCPMPFSTPSNVWSALMYLAHTPTRTHTQHQFSVILSTVGLQLTFGYKWWRPSFRVYINSCFITIFLVYTPTSSHTVRTNAAACDHSSVIP